MTVRRGVLIRRTVTIPQSSISTLTVEESFYLRPFRAVHLLADTDAGPFQRRIASSPCTERMPAACWNAMTGAKSQAAPVPSPLDRTRVFVHHRLQHPDRGGVPGHLYKQSGRLLGEEFQRRLLVGLEGVAGLLAFLPQTGAVLALILMGGWLVGFARNFVCFIRFTVRREEGRRRSAAAG